VAPRVRASACERMNRSAKRPAAGVVLALLAALTGCQGPQPNSVSASASDHDAASKAFASDSADGGRQPEDDAPQEDEPALLRSCSEVRYEAAALRTVEHIQRAENTCANLIWVGGPESIYKGWGGREHQVLSPYLDHLLGDGFIDTTNLASLLHPRTRADIDRIMIDLFGVPSLPEDLPTIREPNVSADHWYKVFLPPAIQATTVVDAYASELIIPSKNLRAISTHIVYTPDPSHFNGRVAILIQGHSDDYLDKEATHFLEAGYAVILRAMPGFANDRYIRDETRDFQGDHDGFYDLESADFNPMVLFVQPNVVAVNLASMLFPGAKVVVAGLSGGAHMALLAHALDQRIARSISVSGWKPFFLRYRQGDKDFEGDYEQNTNRFYREFHLDYLDLVMLATRGARKHYQVWIANDPSYFGGDGYRYYADQLTALTNGKYQLILDEVSEAHQIELAHLDAFFELDLAPPPPPARPNRPSVGVR
jgi:hypothetical protein